MDMARYAPLLRSNETTLLLLVIDGLGGFPQLGHGSELEDATTPNLDRLAREGICGLVEPAGPGVTVGSGPGHLALFGYSPWAYNLGRGVLAAVGVEFPLQPGDVAARGNFAFLDDSGNVTDRRAGRISHEAARPIVERLNDEITEIDGVAISFRHIAEHRVLLVLQGDGLDPRISDLDPQATGVPSLRAEAMDPAAERTCGIINRVDTAIRDVLVKETNDEFPDALLLRGFDGLRDIPPFSDRTGLRACAIASYPMYRGVASLVGMDVLGPPSTFSEQIDLARNNRDHYDYFFVHYKYADAAGHDGDRPAKIAALETLDAQIPSLLDALQPDVVCVSGDHASPTQLSGHSWHPVPTLLYGGSAGVDDVTSFGERACTGGLFGVRPTEHVTPLMLAAANRLAKYGA